MMREILFYDINTQQVTRLIVKNIVRSSKNKTKFEFITIPTYKELGMAKTTLYNVIKKELCLSNDYNVLLNSVFSKIKNDFVYDEQLDLTLEDRVIYMISKRLSFFVSETEKKYNFCISDSLESFLKTFGIALIDVEDTTCAS